jgi:hypothetical protein
MRDDGTSSIRAIRRKEVYMRSISKSAISAGASSNGWVLGGVGWVLLVGVFVSAFVTGRIGFGTLVVAEICAVALGVIALIIGKDLSEPPETVEQILYRIEHPTRP